MLSKEPTAKFEEIGKLFSVTFKHKNDEKQFYMDWNEKLHENLIKLQKNNNCDGGKSKNIACSTSRHYKKIKRSNKNKRHFETIGVNYDVATSIMDANL